MINARFAWLGWLTSRLPYTGTRVFLLFSQNARGQDTCARLETPSNILSSPSLGELSGVVQVCNEKQIFAPGEHRFKGWR